MGQDPAPLVGAIEAGGTKFVCAVGSGPDDIDRTQMATTEKPAEVLAAVAAWLGEQQRRRGQLQAIGVGSFGPIDLDETSAMYGHVTSTPKPGWAHVDIVGALRSSFPGLAIGFDTDVNAAALGEWRWGSAQGLRDFVYITVGTGIGAGGMARGELLHGLLHPEMGHMLLPRVAGDTFDGLCPFHGACWEGLCAGPALERRAGAPAADLPVDHPCWPLAAEYIARGITNIVYVLSPKRVILGGSVPKAGRLGAESFLGLVRQCVERLVNGYVAAPELAGAIDRFIVAPALGDNAGICGAIALGQRALRRLGG